MWRIFHFDLSVSGYSVACFCSASWWTGDRIQKFRGPNFRRSLQRLPCAMTRIQECGCNCSADDYTTIKANITEVVPVRRHTTTLVHPFHHHQPHSGNCPLPIHFMLQCGLFINHRRHILLGEGHWARTWLKFTLVRYVRTFVSALNTADKPESSVTISTQSTTRPLYFLNFCSNSEFLE